MAHRALAVWVMRGVTFSSVGPGASAKNICRPATANWGRMATNRTMMPMPPSQWLRPRQKKKALGYKAKSLRMVAPVVVKPEIDSK